MARKPKPKAAAVPAPADLPHPHYTDTTARIFRDALAAFGEKFPGHYPALKALFDDGQLHEWSEVEAALNGVVQ